MAVVVREDGEEARVDDDDDFDEEEGECLTLPRFFFFTLSPLNFSRPGPIGVEEV